MKEKKSKKIVTKEEILENFNPNDPGSSDSNIYGLPFSEEHADIILIPVPWDVTVSYTDGAAQGPELIMQASKQIDLYDHHYPDTWKHGIYMKEIDESILSSAKKYREKAKRYIDAYCLGKLPEAHVKNLKEINKASEALNKQIQEQAAAIINENKIAAVVGGDHSTPLGLIRALSESHDAFSILQIDAHCDLRSAYEGFDYSHASIMHNALKCDNIKNLVQVGIRDYCQEEADYIYENHKRVRMFHDADLVDMKAKGKNWKKICKKIIEKLDEKVYISFDIDGLKPYLCPGTGTPVPGGLEFEEVVVLLEELIESGRKIIGFDLCEVAGEDNEWNGNVGARVLMKLCAFTLLSHKD